VGGVKDISSQERRVLIDWNVEQKKPNARENGSGVLGCQPVDPGWV